MYLYILATTSRGLVTVLTIIMLVRLTNDSNLYFLITAVVVIGSAIITFSGSALITRLAYNRKIATAIFSVIMIWCCAFTSLAMFLVSLANDIGLVVKCGWYFLWKLLEMHSDSLMLACGKRQKLTRLIFLNTTSVVLLIWLTSLGVITSTQDFLLFGAIAGTALYSIAVLRSHFAFSLKNWTGFVKLSVRKYKYFVLPLCVTTIGSSLMVQGDKLMISLFAEPEFVSEYGFTFVCCFYTYRFFTVAFLQYVEVQYFRHKCAKFLIRYSSLGVVIVISLNILFFVIWNRTSLLDYFQISDDKTLVVVLLLASVFAYLYNVNKIIIQQRYLTYKIMYTQLTIGVVSTLFIFYCVLNENFAMLPFITLAGYISCFLLTIFYHPVYVQLVKQKY